MAALNIRDMKFEGVHGISDGRQVTINQDMTYLNWFQIPLLLDLAFASNVHYIDTVSLSIFQGGK